MLKKHANKDQKPRMIGIIINVIIIVFISLNFLPIPAIKEVKAKIIDIKEIVEKLEEKALRKKKVKACLADKEIPDEVKEKINELNTDLEEYLSNYNVGFKYQEVNYNYEIAYNSDAEFYGASLIKLVDADYLLDKDVDLSKTLKYTKQYIMAYSDKVSKYKVGSDIPISDLINYAISVSDNSAHLMLIDYIGSSSMIEYAKSLGAKYILNGGDLFGNQSADDMIIYLNKAYDLINNNKNGNLLKEAMLNTEVNYLNFDDVTFGHKYGSYNAYFHDVGIYFSDEPYFIAVLTTNDKDKSIVTDISKKVYNIHNTLVKEKVNYCNNIK